MGAAARSLNEPRAGDPKALVERPRDLERRHVLARHSAERLDTRASEVKAAIVVALPGLTCGWLLTSLGVRRWFGREQIQNRLQELQLAAVTASARPAPKRRRR